jgi:ubiquinone/menaquinone biosynthesis C-methylase UbiE
MLLSDWEYHGLAAESYDLWFGDEPYKDQAFFQRKIAEAGGPALEIACGTGRLLIPFLRDGLDIEGVDSSPAMLDICRAKASQQSLQPVLHQQLMQQLDVPRRYGTIFIPFCSFQILTRRKEAFEALRRFHAHLLPGGQLVVSLSVPWEDFERENEWRLRRSGTRPSDGATVLIHEATRCNRLEQIEQVWYRLEVFKDGQLTHSELRTHRLRWYHRHEFTMILEQTGFRDVHVTGDYTDAPACDRSTVLLFSATRPR